MGRCVEHIIRRVNSGKESGMMDYNVERIARNIKELRSRSNWKFSYVSKKTNIEEKRLRKMEKAEVIPRYVELYELSRLFDVTIDELVFKELE